LAILIAAACKWAKLSLANGDMVFVAQKMVSKAEGCAMPLAEDLVKIRRSKARDARQGRFESEHIIALSCDLRFLSAADLEAQLQTSRQVVLAQMKKGRAPTRC